MEQRYQNDRRRDARTMALALGFLLCSAAVQAETVFLPNGLEVRLHGPEALAAATDSRGGTCVLHHPAVGKLELLTGPKDPRLLRAAPEGFVPLDADVVLRALAEVEDLGLDLSVDVLLLPAPPADVLGSYSVRNVIVLSPGFGQTDPRTTAWLVTHELGHVFTWAYFDQRSEIWDRYRELRGLETGEHGREAPHAEREREILAEDLRFLFGGADATWSGAIENQALATPDRIDGLESFLRHSVSGAPVATRVVAASAWPNPCNPRTNVELRLPEGAEFRDGAAARLEILDARGRRVRLVRGGRIVNSRLVIAWGGEGDDGRPAASGRYFYRIGWDGLQGGGALTLVR